MMISDGLWTTWTPRIAPHALGAQPLGLTWPPSRRSQNRSRAMVGVAERSLRERRLGRKRALALCVYALGIEALQRFVDGQPLRRVHEAVIGVLALESDPVDPRL